MPRAFPTAERTTDAANVRRSGEVSFAGATSAGSTAEAAGAAGAAGAGAGTEDEAARTVSMRAERLETACRISSFHAGSTVGPVATIISLGDGMVESAVALSGDVAEDTCEAAELTLGTGGWDCMRSADKLVAIAFVTALDIALTHVLRSSAITKIQTRSVCTPTELLTSMHQKAQARFAESICGSSRGLFKTTYFPTQPAA